MCGPDTEQRIAQAVAVEDFRAIGDLASRPIENTADLEQRIQHLQQAVIELKARRAHYAAQLRDLKAAAGYVGSSREVAAARFDMEI